MCVEGKGGWAGERARERGREGGTKLEMKCLYQSVITMDKREESLQSISDVSDVQNAAPLWDCHRCWRKKCNGHCASSLIDRYQQHGGGACRERQLSVTAKTYKTLSADFTAQEPH